MLPFFLTVVPPSEGSASDEKNNTDNAHQSKQARRGWRFPGMRGRYQAGAGCNSNQRKNNSNKLNGLPLFGCFFNDHRFLRRSNWGIICNRMAAGRTCNSLPAYHLSTGRAGHHVIDSDCRNRLRSGVYWRRRSGGR